eukprot:855282-Pyramimonas_sp.AAC.1
MGRNLAQQQIPGSTQVGHAVPEIAAGPNSPHTVSKDSGYPAHHVRGAGDIANRGPVGSNF